jgi:hypothetical protein
MPSFMAGAQFFCFYCPNMARAQLERKAMSEAQLESLLAVRAIEDALARYCRAMDRMDEALGQTIWHPQGTAEYGLHFSGLGRDFITWVSDFHSKLEGHFHQLGNTLIEVSGQTATSEAYVTASLLARQPDDTRLLTTIHGRYLDRWSSRDGHWAIDARLFICDLESHATIAGHSGHTIAAQLYGGGRRDRDDPSYRYFG